MTTSLLDKDSASNMLSVDFPRQGERIGSPTYTFRVTAPEHASRVDVAVDQGPWRACRKDGLHWWYDWSGYDDGEHEIITRIQTPEGLSISPEPHEFFVDLPR